MKKKKLKKEFKKLQKEYDDLKKRKDALFCENIRLKDERFSDYTDEQILHIANTAGNIMNSLNEAIKKVYK